MYHEKNLTAGLGIKSNSGKMLNPSRIYGKKLTDERDFFINRMLDRVDIENILTHLDNIVMVRNPETALHNLNHTRDYIRRTLRSYNLVTSLEPFVFKKVPDVVFYNVLGYKIGKDKNRILIVNSHYDTHKRSPGADDNASSVAGMLEIARIIAPLIIDCTIQFTFFTLEEYSMMGSYYHLKNMKGKKNYRFIGAIGMDGIGYTSKKTFSQKKFHNTDYPQSDKGDFIGLIGNDNSETLLRLFDYNTDKFVPSLQTEKLIVKGNGSDIPDTRRSDHTPFWDYGYKSILVTDTCQFRNPYVHTMMDTVNKLNPHFLKDTTKAILSSILDICIRR
jgi:hypothetical protein